MKKEKKQQEVPADAENSAVESPVDTVTTEEKAPDVLTDDNTVNVAADETPSAGCLDEEFEESSPQPEEVLIDETDADQGATTEYMRHRERLSRDEAKRTRREIKNFYDPTVQVIEDVFSFRYYNRLKPAAAILLGIALSPFLIAFCALTAAFYITLFFYKMILAPADYLSASMKKEHDQLLIQMIVYFFGYPFVFLLKIMGALMGISFFVLHFFISCFGFIYSLGGMRFHAFLYDSASEFVPFKTTPYGKGENIAALVCALIIIVGGYVLPPVASSISNYVNSSEFRGPQQQSEYSSPDNAYSLSSNSSASFNVNAGDSLWLTVYLSTVTKKTITVSASPAYSFAFYIYEMDNTLTYLAYENCYTTALSYSVPSDIVKSSGYYYVRIVPQSIGSFCAVAVNIN